MKVTIRKLLSSSAALNALLGKSLPAIASFKIARVTQLVSNEITVFDETRTKLQEKYHGVLDEAKKKYKFSPEDEKQVDAEYAALLDAEVEINHPIINISVMGEQTPIEPAIFLALDWLFDAPDATAQ